MAEDQQFKMIIHFNYTRTFKLRSDFLVLGEGSYAPGPTWYLSPCFSFYLFFVLYSVKIKVNSGRKIMELSSMTLGGTKTSHMFALSVSYPTTFYCHFRYLIKGLFQIHDNLHFQWFQTILDYFARHSNKQDSLKCLKMTK